MYYIRDSDDTGSDTTGGTLLEVVGAAVIEAEDRQETDTADDNNHTDLLNTNSAEDWTDVAIGKDLTNRQKHQVKEIAKVFASVFSDLPGATKLT